MIMKITIFTHPCSTHFVYTADDITMVYTLHFGTQQFWSEKWNLTHKILILFMVIFISGGRFNIKMPSYRYRKSHCGDKTILRPSYLHNGISYTGKMTSLYWIRPPVLLEYTILPSCFVVIEKCPQYAHFTKFNLLRLSDTYMCN